MAPAGPDPVWLTTEMVIDLYAIALGMSPAQAADQLRDVGALDGAVGRPTAHAAYADADLALQAAVLAHGIAETQPFVDGNKRAALMAMLTFLEVNGFVLDVDDRELAKWIIGLSEGKGAQELAGHIRAVMHPTG